MNESCSSVASSNISEVQRDLQKRVREILNQSSESEKEDTTQKESPAILSTLNSAASKPSIRHPELHYCASNDIKKSEAETQTLVPLKHKTTQAPVWPPRSLSLKYEHPFMATIVESIRRFGVSKESEKILRNEIEAARRALESGVYVTYRSRRPPPGGHVEDCNVDVSDKRFSNPTDECFRVPPNGKCFCGHWLTQHMMTNGDKKCELCQCKGFRFIPSSPEEIGEWWVSRMAGFRSDSYSVRCQCIHSHLVHGPVAPHACSKCFCSTFASMFSCIVCNGNWEQHDTFFEDATERTRLGRPVGVFFEPFSEILCIQR